MKEKSGILLVKPQNDIEKKIQIFEEFCYYLDTCNITFHCIKFEDIVEASQTADIILFVEEEEFRAATAIFYLTFGEDYTKLYKLKTYKNIWDGALLLERKLLKPYAKTKNETDKNPVIFWMPEAACIIECIFPLIFRYQKAGKNCIVAIATADAIKTGHKNIDDLLMLIKKIEFAGGNCYDINQKSMYLEKYSVCYLCSEYSYILPKKLKRNVGYVVALQTTAMYTHMYYRKGAFYEIFSTDQKNNIDFLITADYMADWICERNNQWHDKLLRFGYPRLDALYDSFLNPDEAPREWLEKVNNKKVILVNCIAGLDGINDDLEWVLDILKEQKDIIIILRPHPLVLEHCKDYIQHIQKQYNNIIIDNMLSYYTAFNLSDGFISYPLCSLVINYLYTGKPLCIYETHLETKVAINYRKEAWYKSAYIALCEKQILEFIEVIRNGREKQEQQQSAYRQQVTSNFDGKVCDRIYEYFEKKI